MEEWRNVPGYEGKYQISIDTKEGRCKSLNYNRTGKPKEMSVKPDHEGRIYWNLSLNGKASRQQAAVWIALTYPELIQNEWFKGAEIDHIDGNKLNNYPSNLRWVTTKENCNNPITVAARRKRGRENAPWKGKHLTAETKKKISNKLKGRKLPMATITKHEKKVCQYTKTGDLVRFYESIKKAEEETGINDGNICSCCKGRVKYAGGFKWKYA